MKEPQPGRPAGLATVPTGPGPVQSGHSRNVQEGHVHTSLWGLSPLPFWGLHFFVRLKKELGQTVHGPASALASFLCPPCLPVPSGRRDPGGRAWARGGRAGYGSSPLTFSVQRSGHTDAGASFSITTALLSWVVLFLRKVWHGLPRVKVRVSGQWGPPLQSRRFGS